MKVSCLEIFKEPFSAEGVQQLPALASFPFETDIIANRYVAFGIVVGFMLIPCLIFSIFIRISPKKVCGEEKLRELGIAKGKKLSIIDKIALDAPILIIAALIAYTLGLIPTQAATNEDGALFHSSRITAQEDDDIENIRGSWIHVNHDLVQKKIQNNESGNSLALYDVKCDDMPEERERASILCGGDILKEVTAYKGSTEYTLTPELKTIQPGLFSNKVYADIPEEDRDKPLLGLIVLAEMH